MEDYSDDEKCCLNCVEMECEEMGHACFECLCSKCIHYEPPEWVEDSGRCSIAESRRAVKEQAKIKREYYEEKKGIKITNSG